MAFSVLGWGNTYFAGLLGLALETQHMIKFNDLGRHKGRPGSVWFRLHQADVMQEDCLWRISCKPSPPPLLLGTNALLVVTSALLVVTKSYPFCTIQPTETRRGPDTEARKSDGCPLGGRLLNRDIRWPQGCRNSLVTGQGRAVAGYPRYSQMVFASE